MKPVDDTSENVPEKTIRKLADLLKSTDLAEIEITSKDLTIRVRSRESQTAVMVGSSGAVSGPMAAVSAPTKAKSADAYSDLHVIRSPFIGTFYRAASPTSSTYVEQGQTVSKGSTLCIVEAMKMMNEIEADCGGVIEKIFVENGEPVEFNTALFGIRR